MSITKIGTKITKQDIMSGVVHGALTLGLLNTAQHLYLKKNFPNDKNAQKSFLKERLLAAKEHPKGFLSGLGISAGIGTLAGINNHLSNS
jgi:hypothetical protein